MLEESKDRYALNVFITADKHTAIKNPSFEDIYELETKIVDSGKLYYYTFERVNSNAIMAHLRKAGCKNADKILNPYLYENADKKEDKYEVNSYQYINGVVYCCLDERTNNSFLQGTKEMLSNGYYF